jgi:hypothetical protein
MGGSCATHQVIQTVRLLNSLPQPRQVTADTCPPRQDKGEKESKAAPEPARIAEIAHEPSPTTSPEVRDRIEAEPVANRGRIWRFIYLACRPLLYLS